MDLDNAKENIQPLATGRNIERLEVALNAESQHEIQEALHQQRKEFDAAIRNYSGDDPLEPWYEYIQWVEQSYPKSGKESALDELVQKCLTQFENYDIYKQDRRMIKLYIKYIDSQPNPHDHFQILYNQGIGTMVADLYICWAYFYDVNDQFEKAESIFSKGIDARAEPFDQLDHAHKQFGFSMSQRLLHKSDMLKRKEFQATMEERRFALTSLRSHKHKTVGSIRTGSAVKSFAPGSVPQMPAQKSRPTQSNVAVKVFEENPSNTVKPNIQAHGSSTSVVQTIMDSSRKQENLREPGPWTKAKLKNSKNVFPNKCEPQLGFSIMEDNDDMALTILMDCDDDMHKIGIQLPKKFCKTNLPQTAFDVPQFIEEEVLKPNVIPAFDKIMLFPVKDKGYSIEELAAYKWFKKRCIENDFTRRQDKIWKNQYNVGIRLPPQFCTKNDKQSEFNVLRLEDDEKLNDLKNYKFVTKFMELYPENCDEEFSIEEVRRKKMLESCDMEQTICIKGRQSIFTGVRKSIVPGGRKSIMPSLNNQTILDRRTIFQSIQEEENASSRIKEENASSRIKEGNASSRITEENASARITEELLEPKKSIVGPQIFGNMFKKIEQSNYDEMNPTQSMQVPVLAFDKNTEQVRPRSPTRMSILTKKIDFPKNRGVTRKSVCFKPTDEIQYMEMPSSNSPNENPKEKHFEIFQDISSDASPDALRTPPRAVEPMLCTENDQIIFKTPNLPAIDQLKNSYQTEKMFLPNDTCSTQTFNFFIKSQSVSTPKQSQKRQPLTQRDLSPEKIEQQITSDGPNTNPSNISPLENFSVAPRQLLSTIMETTETNTISSATGSTKSSVDIQTISSPENECESSKPQQPSIITKSVHAIPGDSEMNLSTFAAIEVKPTNQRTSSTELTLSKCTIAEHKSPSQPFMIYEDKTETFSKNMFMAKNSTKLHTNNMQEESFKIDSVQNRNRNETIPGIQINESIVPPQCYSKNITIPSMCPINIYEDKTETIPHIMFNKDQTANEKSMVFNQRDITIPSMCPINVYEDKTENIPKMVFNKDRTVEPIPFTSNQRDITIPSMCPINVYEDKTETIPKMVFNKDRTVDPIPFTTNQRDITIPSMCPINMYEDKTETISKMVFNKDRTVNEKSMIFYQRDITMPSMCPINVSENRTETISNKTSNQNKMEGQFELVPVEKDITVPSMEPFNIYEDRTGTIPKMILTKNYTTSLQQENINPPMCSTSIYEDYSENIPQMSSTISNTKPSKSTISTSNAKVLSSFKSNNIQPKSNHDELDLLTTDSPKEDYSFFDTFGKSPTHKNVGKMTSVEQLIPIKPPKLDNSNDRFKSKIPTSNKKIIKGDNQSFLLEPLDINAKSHDISGFADEIASNIKTENLPHLSDDRKSVLDKSKFQNQSLHIKEEPSIPTMPKIVSACTLSNWSFSFRGNELDLVKSEQDHNINPSVPKSEEFQENENFMENSIYAQPRSPIKFSVEKHANWEEMNDNSDETQNNEYIHKSIDFEETKQIINMIDENVDPHDKELQKVFLESVEFTDYLQHNMNDQCVMVNKIGPLRPYLQLSYGTLNLHVEELIGKGSYGCVFKGKCLKSGKTYALKQERPANLWEYYVCIEIQSRIENLNILPAFMNIEHAYIGNNASVFVSEFGKYGSLINVCNKHKNATGKNLDECIVMLLGIQMLSAIDHLHAVGIIHCDIKPDNFLLMRELSNNKNLISVQLIDFGQSIDMKRYPAGQTFQTNIDTKNFTCTEMMSNKPWTFQTDLFCLAGTMHTILFGIYMNVIKKICGYQIKNNIPRYYSKFMWEYVFDHLINIRDCNSRPNLQRLRSMMLEKLDEKEKVLNDIIHKFNSIMER